ncbi:RagB/SusD family nutrient uptake outer membrane protein [Sphingobacterium sp. DK4209]|uniref:RagB/SusD family nutrient uptake outer membrane protein n=1 Tax=Sphingobacterium zhuxiongii TaxID=2662364 RepID=A0A5Q0QFH0_9SPHI|nr:MULTISPECIES: RagB/SusD family nutrient uptake outer membrane protein [unclassified Sphingobacterium]MVZ67000.1 RagB/SusD family nutrient uptake outer membrane protein [Sphingobacterium sp. DK4209]QGA25940.1 RagB/SusD family nutrient uptake outer membrane protein [Sphingobacterium sp. dk4302]
MKKILALIMICSLFSCKKDLLDTSPNSSVSTATMWTTDNLTDLGIAGVYNTFRLMMGHSGLISPYELYQFDRFSFTGQGRFDEPLMLGTITAGDGMFLNYWKIQYEGIQRANDAIKNIPVKSPSSEDKKAKYIAEAKFLRAYFYFRLNQLYKGVPIYLEPFTAAEATRGRSSEEEVWQQIISDLTDCINEKNFPDRYQGGNANYGHATKAAAYSLRGKVYIYKKEWAKAAADFQKVKDAGHSLFADYKALFKEANEQAPEMIFSIQHRSESGYGNNMQLFCGWPSVYSRGWNYYMPTPYLVDLYENLDGSPFNWDQVIPGYSALSVNEREVYFLRDNISDAERAAATLRGAKMSLYLANGNEERIKKAYENRDPRLAANVVTPYSTFRGAYNFTIVESTQHMRWPFRGQAQINGDIQSDTQINFFYFYRKFVAEGTNEIIDRNYGPIDFPIFRYADILLMWAEALNEDNKLEEAVSKVNEVRQRAGIALLNSNAVTQVNGKADLRLRIQNERRVEFPNEGINYFDELRWGTWKEKVFQSGNGRKQIWGTNVSNYSYKGDFLSVWPIPTSEIQMNVNLVQNPGWID